MADRAALVAASRDAIEKGSRSFAVASRLFDAATRERAWLLYHWCRYCDDVIDGQLLGQGRVEAGDSVEARLAHITAGTRAAMAGKATGVAAFDALGVIVAETGLPARYPHELLQGFAMDARDRSYRSFEDTLDYCYHVAGVVGVMMAIVMGVKPDDWRTLERAADLGIAFQLANIARDVVEDADRGRCYLPDEWLADADIPPDMEARPNFRPQLAQVAARLAAEAERYEASARYGTPALPFRSAWAVLAAAGIYGDIARKVARLGGRAWDHRVSTSTAAKLGWVARSLPAAVTRRRFAAAPPSRDGLWTMEP